MKVEFLTLPNGKTPVEDFFRTLDDKSLAKVYNFIEKLEVNHKLTFPHARKIEGYKSLWEMRIKSHKGAIRVFYVYWGKDLAILINGFLKKSQKTPKRELERVVKYLKESGIKI